MAQSIVGINIGAPGQQFNNRLIPPHPYVPRSVPATLSARLTSISVRSNSCFTIASQFPGTVYISGVRQKR